MQTSYIFELEHLINHMNFISRSLKSIHPYVLDGIVWMHNYVGILSFDKLVMLNVL